jgi:hypothetical protein
MAHRDFFKPKGNYPVLFDSESVNITRVEKYAVYSVE